MPEKLDKGARVTGPSRERLAATLRKQYEEEGESIREIAAATGRSYGFVHRLLSESGVKLRGRGGAPRSRKKAKEQPERESAQEQRTDEESRSRQDSPPTQGF